MKKPRQITIRLEEKDWQARIAHEAVTAVMRGASAHRFNSSDLVATIQILLNSLIFYAVESFVDQGADTDKQERKLRFAILITQSLLDETKSNLVDYYGSKNTDA